MQKKRGSFNVLVLIIIVLVAILIILVKNLVIAERGNDKNQLPASIIQSTDMTSEKEKDDTKDNGFSSEEKKTTAKYTDETEKEREEEKKREKTEPRIQKDTNHKKDANDYAYDTKYIRSVTDYNYRTEDYQGEKIAFLTFDDGPSTVTPEILDILKNKGVHATFFSVGWAINEDNKTTLDRIYDEGHAIAMHSFSHDYSYLYPGRYANSNHVHKEYKKSITALKNIFGDDFDCKVWRYPGGHMSWNEMSAADKALSNEGVEWIDWNAMSGDAEPDGRRPETKEEMVSFLESTINGQEAIVILMHDSETKQLTRDTLPRMIDFLKDEGYSFGILE